MEQPRRPIRQGSAFLIFPRRCSARRQRPTCCWHETTANSLAWTWERLIRTPAAYERLRDGWRDLAARHGARFRAIECVCSDEQVHHGRIDGRQRGIPGWYELTWQEVEDARSRYEPWLAEHLVLDAVAPLDRNLAALAAYLIP